MNYSLYVHIPFCQHRCHYCDFITYTGKESLIPDYIEALISELRIVLHYFEKISLHSIYFGGGTPSLIPVGHYDKLMRVLRQEFIVDPLCEISLEANPGTISLGYLRGLHKLGFNRLSLGVQSTDSFDLVRLDRIHTIENVLVAFRDARLAGFENINLDMIFGLPWQDLNSWERSLIRAIDLSPEHFSLYSLIIEPGTPLFYWHQKGLIAQQDEELEAEMYERAMELLQNAGYQHYEISNWAKQQPGSDFRCRHNLQYWLNLPYFGIGVGAHGFVGGFRTENVTTIPEFIHLLGEEDEVEYKFPSTPATIATSEVDQTTQMNDFMWLGLRLVDEGVSIERFYKMYNQSMTAVFGEQIDELLGLGLIKWVDDGNPRIKLTQRGILIANQVFMRFV
jgi:oxygen-independent coproporphyrinogen-3 oxidase